MLGYEKEFVIPKAQTHGPEHGAACQYSEPSVIPLSHTGVDVAHMRSDQIGQFLKVLDVKFWYNYYQF